MSVVPQLTVVADDAQQDSSDCCDRLLLDAWTSHRDSDAFAALVRRYTGLVIGVCRRQCHCVEDAEDAFQATFLELSRKAKRLRRTECLAGWLHQVAYRTASRTRAKHRPMDVLIEEPSDPHESLVAIAHRHRLRTLDEELERLPESYRNAVVLHYFEGYSYDQTAELLSTTEPAIRGRLQRARKRLQRRLIRRGISLSVSFAALLATGGNKSVSAALVVQTVGNATHSGTIEPSLESLLAPESSVMFSPAIIAITSAATLTIAGLLVGQIGIPDAGTERSKITFASDVPQQGDSQIISQETPAAAKRQESDPFGSAVENTASESPASENPADYDPFHDSSLTTRSVEAVTRLAADGAGASKSQTDAAQKLPEQIPWATANPDAYASIEKKLSEPVSFSFIESPLEVAIEQLQEKFEVPFLIDLRALEEIGLTPDTPVNLILDKASLQSGLNLMLRELDLTYTIDDEHLQITTVESDEVNHQLLRIYWVNSSGLQANDGSAALIQTMINPDTWSQQGGHGEITILGASNENASGFAIRTTYRTHRKIEDFLASVRAGTTQPLSGIVTENRANPLVKPTNGDNFDEMMMHP